MAFTAFQFGFQAGAFQVVVGASPAPRPGGGHKDKYIGQSYEISKYTWEQAERERRSLEAQREEAKIALKAKEYQIQALEDKRLRDLADQKMQAQLLQYLVELQALQAEQQRLEEMIAWYIREEDDILTILYCLPFAT